MRDKKKYYTKSPVKVSTLLPKILKPSKNKLGLKLLDIKLNWTKILGKEIADKCFVSSLNVINNRKILTIISKNNNIFELTYSSDVIKNKINNFFLKAEIDEVKFKKSLQL